MMTPKTRRQAVAMTIGLLAVMVPALALSIEAEYRDWAPVVGIAMAGGVLAAWILVPPGAPWRLYAIAMTGGAVTAACTLGGLYLWLSWIGRDSGRLMLVGLLAGGAPPAAISLHFYERMRDRGAVPVLSSNDRNGG